MSISASTMNARVKRRPIKTRQRILHVLLLSPTSVGGACCTDGRPVARQTMAFISVTRTSCTPALSYYFW